MNRSTRTAALLTSLALLIFVAGCNTAKIGDINRDPGRYAGKEVTISGRVINSLGALGERAISTCLMQIQRPLDALSSHVSLLLFLLVDCRAFENAGRTTL